MIKVFKFSNVFFLLFSYELNNSIDRAQIFFVEPHMTPLGKIYGWLKF